jgi:hypothetical protein
MLQTLGLIIAGHGVKPAVAMKPLLTTFAFLALATAAIIAVVSCSTQTIPPPNQNVELFLGDPHANPQRYVDLQPGAEGRLRAALAKIKRHNGICEITFLDHANGTPNPHYCENTDVRLKTNRVIKSAAAKNAGADNSVANDPNLMYRVASPYPGDISDVASLLK